MNVRIVGVVGVLVLLGGAAWWLAMVPVDEVDEPCLTLDDEATSVPSGGSPWETPSGPSTREALVTVPFAPEEGEGVLQGSPNGARVLVTDKATGSPVKGAMVFLGDLAARPESGALVAEEGILGDVEGWLRRSGSRYRTDARGIARVSAYREGFVGAGRGGLWGQTRIPGPEEDVRIAIEPRRDVRVLVVDEAGRPLAGVPVAIGAAEGGPVVSADAQGCVSFRNAHQVLEDAGLSRQRVTVSLGVPVRTPELEVDPWDPPRDPVRLVMPATGTVVVRVVDHRGAPVGTGFVDLALEEDGGPGRDVPRRQVRRARESWEITSGMPHGTVFPWVGLGGSVRATWYDGSGKAATARVPGPAAAGEEVPLSLTVTGSGTVLLMRVMDGAGVPIAGESMLVTNGPSRSRRTHEPVQSLGGMSLVEEGTLVGMARGQEWKLFTDEDGLLRVALDPWEPGTDRVLWLHRLGPRGGVVAEGRFEATRPFPPGLVPAGDVVLRPVPLVAAGIVVDDQGRPVPGIDVLVEDRSPSGFEWLGRERWLPIPQHAEPSGDDGRFEVVGVTEEARVRVRARAAGYRDAVSEPLVPGSTGVRLVLRRVGSLVGRVLVDRGIPSKRLYVAVTPSIGSNYPVVASVDQRGAFEVKDVLAGSVRVSVHLGDGRIPDQVDGGRAVASVEGIRIAPGETTESPLSTLDLRGQLHAVRVTVLDPTGRPDRYNVIEARDARDRVLQWSGLASATFLTDTLPFDITVSGQGFRRETRHGVDRDLTVTRRHGLPVELRLPVACNPDPPWLPAVRLQPTAVDDRAFDAVGVFGDCGVACFTAQEVGPHRASFVLWDGLRAVPVADDGGLIEIRDTTAVQSFTLPVTAEDVRRAVGSVRESGR